MNEMLKKVKNDYLLTKKFECHRSNKRIIPLVLFYIWMFFILYLMIYSIINKKMYLLSSGQSFKLFFSLLLWLLTLLSIRKLYKILVYNKKTDMIYYIILENDILKIKTKDMEYNIKISEIDKMQHYFREYKTRYRWKDYEYKSSLAIFKDGKLFLDLNVNMFLKQDITILSYLINILNNKLNIDELNNVVVYKKNDIPKITHDTNYIPKNRNIYFITLFIIFCIYFVLMLGYIFIKTSK